MFVYVCFVLRLCLARFLYNKEHNKMVPDETQSHTSRPDTVYKIFYLSHLTLQSSSPSLAMYIGGTNSSKV